ncbi:unnamed protein product [Lampetra planeri]
MCPGCRHRKEEMEGLCGGGVAAPLRIRPEVSTRRRGHPCAAAAISFPSSGSSSTGLGALLVARAVKVSPDTGSPDHTATWIHPFMFLWTCKDLATHMDVCVSSSTTGSTISISCASTNNFSIVRKSIAT